MKSFIFSTNNKNKVQEIRSVLTDDVKIISLEEANINVDIPEPHDTLEENALEKSMTIYRLTGLNCFSEDTGLEVMMLNGEPGVKSARYAGDGKDFKKNIEKLLAKLKMHTDRQAQFRTVISLIIEGQEWQFEGICKGVISEKESGANGFGYDAVFIPEGSIKTFAEMSLEEKNKYSHRKKAVEKLIRFLKDKYAEN